MLDHGTLGELAEANLIDAYLGGGTKLGYVFRVAPSSTSPEFLWVAAADPAVPGTAGDAGVAWRSTPPAYFGR